MKNKATKAYDGQGLKLKLPVPEGTREGVPTRVGEMRVLPTTPRVTPELRRQGLAPQGLRDGEASCVLLGLGSLLYTGAGTELGPLFDNPTPGQKVYLTGTTLASAGTEQDHIGFVVPLPEPMRGYAVALRGN
ncbi:hypothetical protein [Deinococcus wulumuqiensis]|uniref:hypothetical protein n=1 Tax=Deinococcus wulumuqiensis TaxID=980427 RepID=UPI00242BB111|nr:hypothetical protein [Deinococcus wulumuqiensis]